MADNILQAIITDMLSQAKARPGELVRHVLNHGLWVQLKIQGETIHLYLSRQAVYPSRKELDTILKYWPTKTDCIDPPAQQEFKGRFYIYATLKSQ